LVPWESKFPAPWIWRSGKTLLSLQFSKVPSRIPGRSPDRVLAATPAAAGRNLSIVAALSLPFGLFAAYYYRNTQALLYNTIIMPDINCRSCFAAIPQPENAARLEPCQCTLCPDCLIDFLTGAIATKPTVVCCSVCFQPAVSHHRTRRGGASQKEEGKEQEEEVIGWLVTPPKEGETALEATGTAAATSKLPAKKRKAAGSKTDTSSSTASKPKSASPVKKRRKLPVAEKTDKTGDKTDTVAAPQEEDTKQAAAEDTKPSSSTKPRRPRKYRPRLSFDQRVQDLAAYKAQHGDCWVPYAYPPDPSLGEWVKDVRRHHIQITKEQRLALNQVGFQWETKARRMDREWNEKLERLRAFAQNHGHCRVPQKYVDPAATEAGAAAASPLKSSSLYEWCLTQRKLYRKGQLREDRREKLEAVGLEWNPGQSSAQKQAQAPPHATADAAAGAVEPPPQQQQQEPKSEEAPVPPPQQPDAQALQFYEAANNNSLAI